MKYKCPVVLTMILKYFLTNIYYFTKIKIHTKLY